MIDVTGINLAEFARAVYALSVPVGMGFLHYKSGELPNEDAEQIVADFARDPRIALGMDYVKGRCCKMFVRRDGDRLGIDVSWYDHTNEQLATLLGRFNIAIPAVESHGNSCECNDCKLGVRAN
jgi:hypothetical protein